jgi:CheY-like chemotaxis protein
VVEHLLPTVRKVLLVGAQNGLREAVEESLPKTRFEVSATPTGAVALEFAWHTRYDAVVVAHPLVDRPTARFLGTLRSHGCACRSSAVVLLTNGHGGQEAEELIGAGANRIVPESALKRKLAPTLRGLFKIAPRVSLKLPSRIEFKDRGVPRRMFCEAVNISSTGMLLHVPHTFPCGTELDFEVFLPNQSPLRGRVVVTRQTRQGREPFPGIGVVFSAFDEVDRRRLIGHIEKLTPHLLDVRT